MRFLPLPVVFLAFGADAQPVATEDAKLVGSGTSDFANQGWSIAAADGYVVHGGRLDDSVYVFRETADGWEEEGALTASQESFFTFGQAVGAWSDGREDLVIVGARGDSFEPETDAAYVFRKSGEVWVEEARLSNGPDAHEAFGNAVAVHGSYAVVGAPGADDAGGTTGAAYVFRRTTDGAWVEDARLVASDASSPAGFGLKVAIVVSHHGVPFILAGAPSDNSQQGAAYAFRRTPEGIWVEEAKLVEPDPEPDTGGLFGRAVALAETPEGELLALAGELGDQNNGPQTGAGYVYRRESDGTWVFEEKLTAADGQIAQRLGWSVALAAAPDAGGTVAVLSGNGSAGAVRLFRRTMQGADPVWSEEAELRTSDRARIGYSVAASSQYAVAGAPYDYNSEDSPVRLGTGYVWNLRRAVPTEPAPVSNAERKAIEIYPNPASRSATITTTLNRPAAVRVSVFDVLGREVAVLHDGPLTADEHTFTVEALALPSGFYVVRATGVGVSAAQRFTVVR